MKYVPPHTCQTLPNCFSKESEVNNPNITYERCFLILNVLLNQLNLNMYVTILLIEVSFVNCFTRVTVFGCIFSTISAIIVNHLFSFFLSFMVIYKLLRWSAHHNFHCNQQQIAFPSHYQIFHWMILIKTILSFNAWSIEIICNFKQTCIFLLQVCLSFYGFFIYADSEVDISLNQIV